MSEGLDELARLNRRIVDLRNRIEEAERRDSQSWGRSERFQILDLLNGTLKDLEARKATLERPRRK